MLLVAWCCRRYLYNQTAKWLKNRAGVYNLDGIYVWTAGASSMPENKRQA